MYLSLTTANKTLAESIKCNAFDNEQWISIFLNLKKCYPD